MLMHESCSRLHLQFIVLCYLTGVCSMIWLLSLGCINSPLRVALLCVSLFLHRNIVTSSVTKWEWHVGNVTSFHNKLLGICLGRAQPQWLGETWHGACLCVCGPARITRGNFPLCCPLFWHSTGDRSWRENINYILRSVKDMAPVVCRRIQTRWQITNLCRHSRVTMIARIEFAWNRLIVVFKDGFWC